MNIEARPTVYNGVTMRSRLEARAAAGLDARGIAWRYEPECFASSAGQYLPDFELENVEHASDACGVFRRIFLEVKPRLDDWGDQARQINEQVARMAIIRESIPDAVTLLLTPGMGDYVLKITNQLVYPATFSVCACNRRAVLPLVGPYGAMFTQGRLNGFGLACDWTPGA